VQDTPPGDDRTENPPPDGDEQALAQAATNTPQPTAPAFPSPTAQTDGRIIYEVVEGDTLSAIASRFGIELEQLYALNDLNEDSLIRIGQAVVLGSEGRDGDVDDLPAPLPPGVELGEDGNLIYEVQEGDTLLAIAVRYDLSLEEILALNPALGGDSLLQLGQQIVVGQRRQPESVGGSTDMPQGTGTATPVTQGATATLAATSVMMPTETRSVATATATQALAASEGMGTPSGNDQLEGATREAAPIAERSTPTWLMVVIIFVVITGASGITLLILGARKSAGREPQ
jgi:LysM repeat protein